MLDEDTRRGSSHDVTLSSAVGRVLTELRAAVPPKSSTSSWVGAEKKREDVSGHEREQHQTWRHFLIPSPLQTNEKLLGKTG